MSLLLPTPAAPQTTIPDESGADMAASTIRSSSERPVSGHLRRIRPSYDHLSKFAVVTVVFENAARQIHRSPLESL
jgi:hypothetical protein